MLTLEDFQNLLLVVRSAVPSSFTAGKSLVVLEGKLLQVLQANSDAQVQQKIDAALAEQANAQTEPDGDD